MARSQCLLICALLTISATAQDISSTLHQARLFIDQGDFEKALHALEAIKPESKPDPEILYLRGYVLYRLQRLPAAAQELKAALAIDPQHLRSKYILGRIAQSGNNPAEAIRWFEPCASATPPIEDAVQRLGKLYWDTGQFKPARAWTEKAIAATPWDGSLHYRLARIYQQSSEQKLAADEFALSVKAKSADAGAVQKLMECAHLLSANDAAAAGKIRDEFLNGPPLDPDLLVALGATFAGAGQPDQAVDLFKTAAQRDPGSFQANFNLGLALLNVKRTADAVGPLQASLQLAPSSKEANAALALAFVLQDNYKDAVAPLEAASAADPHDKKLAGLLSVAYYRTGAPAKAIPILRNSIQASPDDPRLYFLLMDCLNAAEKQQEALEIADQAVTRFPDLSQAWLGKAQQLARIGRYHDASPLFAKAAALAPDRVEPLLGLAEAQQKDGAYEESLATYQRAIQLNRDVTAVLGAARDLIFLNRLAEARTLLEQSVPEHADSSQLHLELSRVYARIGEKQLAEEQTRIVQQLRTQPE
ncbi:MAG TPA: tetratricopeptide repeat protein [Bryobacteraceae bacterium]|jgi:tetratricopeptide (TPR) repeat protein|nr:tetratricopeptide repeat protein [Bryobacteraceae bacterium]